MLLLFFFFLANVHCCFSNFTSSFLRQKLTDQGSLALAATNCKRIARGDKSSGAAHKTTRAARALTAGRIALYSNISDGLCPTFLTIFSNGILSKLQVYRFPPSCTVQRPWFLYRKQIRLLKRFHQRCLCSILGIKWQNHVSNEEVLKRASLPSIEPILLQVQLRWARHKDGRRSHAQRSLLQQAPRRKARSWCSKKALQRPAEETTGTGGNQPSVMAAGGLRPRQLVLISEKNQL